VLLKRVPFITIGILLWLLFKTYCTFGCNLIIILDLYIAKQMSNVDYIANRYIRKFQATL